MRLDRLRFAENYYKIILPCGLSLESVLTTQALLKLNRMNRAFTRRKDKPTIHTPEALVRSHVVYNAKFLGITEVEEPKGTDVVRVAIRKLKFQKHIKKSEGQKTPKVELQISIYGVKILDPKTKEMQHSCQLHRMSFCADDKTDKRIFTFICTEPETKKHLCYVFDSEKCAEEITLAIGQAFDLAYKKFLESGGKDVEMRKQIGNLQKRAGSIQATALSTDIFDMVPFTPASPITRRANCNGISSQYYPLPPKDRDIDMFGAEPFDPFICGPAVLTPDIQSKLEEMQEGFQMGLTLEGTVFSLDQVDSRC
ncbi:PTB domain-containing engulfment adapter protein 1 isoform X6 [Myxocyprinus asiaticus]|uniref:PTB domain-containing engulfment adapter protein 1 isoform X6 n=1 Tax=Myxocyprinus asiaticus TaxID=70543 RepID=UPI0022237E9C|nr:PTB domain-containing engulfment adapter protein 1 isoform X6 [Myxocyprinus asiaticus]